MVIQERDANNVPLVTYTRGRDLSGTFQGAGGIGGLLARTDNNAGTHAYYHADGNGNITCLIDASQSAVAEYLYDPFGRILGQSGSLADANLYRFSSKESHVNSGLVYYLYRFYDPNLQRWPNRDPLGVGAASTSTVSTAMSRPTQWTRVDFRSGTANPQNILALEEAEAAAEGYPNVAAWRAAQRAADKLRNKPLKPPKIWKSAASATWERLPRSLTKHLNKSKISSTT